MRTVAVYNLKGGVGKTATAVNIAYLAALQGMRTLLWDLDPQGAASWYLTSGMDNPAKAVKILKGKVPIGNLVVKTRYDRLDVIPADFSYRKFDQALKQTHNKGKPVLDRLINPFGETYSLVILDCPPSLSNLAEQIFRMADVIIAPVVPTYLSINTFAQIRTYLKKHKLGHKRLYPFFTMVDIRRTLHRNLIKQPPDVLKQLLPAIVPYSSIIEKMGEHRAPLSVYARTHPAAQAYENLYRQIMNIL